MEKVRIIIIEDEFAIAEDMRTKLCQTGYEVVAVFDNAEAALPFILVHQLDLLLVDIRLAGAMNGIQLTIEVKKTKNLPIIYVTANSDELTYKRARQTNPNAFLIKPFTEANLLAAVDLALFNFSTNATPDAISRPVADTIPNFQLLVNQCLFIRLNGKFKKVSIDDILFVEASGSYVHVQTTAERYTLSQNLTHFQQKTHLPNLVRIHRSYMANLNKVDSFEDSFVFIQNHKLPLSEAHRSEFLNRIHCL